MIEFLVSGMTLDVMGPDPAAGTCLWQYDRNGTDAQNYSFEDQGDGFVCIQSHVSRLDITAKTRRVRGVPGANIVLEDKETNTRAGTSQLSSEQRWKFSDAGDDGQGG